MGSFRANKGSSGKTSWCCTQPLVFRHKPTEELFQSYAFHIGQASISYILGVFILLTAVLSILYFSYQQKPTEDNFYHAALCLFGIVLYIFINTRYLTGSKQLRVVAYLLWVLLLLFAFKSLPLGAWTQTLNIQPVYHADGLWQVLFAIYCMFLIAPVNFFISVIFGLLLSMVYIGVLLVRLEEPSKYWKQLVVNSVVLLVTNVIGMVIHHASEKSQRKSFINCRGFIGAKIEAEDQCMRLAKIMELCLPKFMCSEVCADLTMYNDCVGPRRTFAKVYDCVCFACINITGLEQLKGQVETSEYISIISDLCSTFDSLCEVHNCLAVVSLGDSFVAVNGIPISDPEGAKSCVLLSLDMLQAVQVIRQTKGTSIEALTGVHYGSVTSGVVGMYRWQYKCCGNDLLLAKHVALTGTSGKVHITEPCVSFLPLEAFEIQQSTISHGISVPTYFLKARNSCRMQPAVMKLSRKMNRGGSTTSFLRMESMENEEPFYRQLSRANESRSGVTNRLFDGKAFARRSTHDVSNDYTNKAFQVAITNGSVEQDTSNVMSFFTMRFLDHAVETSFGQECLGFGMTLTCFLVILVALSTLHFMLLPRTILLLASMLFLFLMISLLLISLLASKLQVLTCKCFSSSANKFALVILVSSLIACTTFVNVATCEGSSYYTYLPKTFTFGILNTDLTVAMCFSSPYYVVLSGVMVMFLVAVTQISHLAQSILLILIACGYISYVVVISYTSPMLYASHNKIFRENLPPAIVMAIVAIIHFLILHALTGRHLEWIRRLDFLWRNKELTEYHQAQDMVTLRQGVVDNALPAHVLTYYNTSDNATKPFSNTHQLAGVAFVTIPNFPAMVAEMDRSKQSVEVMQILHDITTAFDHLLRRSDFRVVEKVFDQGLTMLLVSGVTDSMGPLHQGMQHEYAMFHLCKLLDLLLDMKHCLNQLNAMSGRSLVIRAGMSMGVAMEGTFGYSKPQYNIWGPAVEMAKKLEMTGKINQIQVNKEMAQCMRQLFQFQPRAQTSMPVLAELQPYYLLGRRLQSVIASDNVSLASNLSKARSPQHVSMGSISLAETVLATSQQPLLSALHGRTRTTSADSNGMIPYSNHSGNSTPSGSIGKHMTRETFRDSLHSWKIPQTPSASRLANSARPMSPELPTVHYSKISTPPTGRLGHSDSRGMIILTQANLSGDNLPSLNQSINSLPTTVEEQFIVQTPAISSSPQAKLANVISTNSMRGNSPKRSAQLSPVGEMVAVSATSAPGKNMKMNGYSPLPERKAHNKQSYHVENSTETEPLLAEINSKKPPISGLEKLMQTSLFSDRMQSSMEGNVSSTSTTPEDGPIMFQSHDSTNFEERKLLKGNPSLSPLLKHQLHKFSMTVETPHKSPHLPRKSSKSSPHSTASRGSNAINSLASPTHSQSTIVSATSPCSILVNNGNDVRRCSSSSSDRYAKQVSRSPKDVISDISSEEEDDNSKEAYWAGARPKQNSINMNLENQLPYLLTMPSPPADPATESELSDDDDQIINNRGNNDTSATEYDNMYSTDNGTLEKHYDIPFPTQNGNRTAAMASKFASKLERMQNTSHSIKELYSELESDAADCESLVGDTDYEIDIIPSVPPTKDYNHPLQKLEWTESKLLALLKPTINNSSTMGSSLRYCRSMELLPSESPEDADKLLKRLSERPGKHGTHRLSQLFDDNASITSSHLGSEFSRSDPNLSDSAAYDSEYDNYLPGMTSDEDFFTGDPISDVDLTQFDDIDFDKIKISENMTTEEYMQSLQEQIEQKQKQHSVTDV